MAKMKLTNAGELDDLMVRPPPLHYVSRTDKVEDVARRLRGTSRMCTSCFSQCEPRNDVRAVQAPSIVLRRTMRPVFACRRLMNVVSAPCAETKHSIAARCTSLTASSPELPACSKACARLPLAAHCIAPPPPSQDEAAYKAFCAES